MSLDGNPTTADFAGTGGGTANPDFVQRIADQDRSTDAPTDNYPGCGHSPHIERPVEVAAELLALIRHP